MKKWQIYLALSIVLMLIAVLCLNTAHKYPHQSGKQAWLAVLCLVFSAVSSFFYTAFTMEVRYGNVRYDKDQLRKKLTITTDLGFLVFDERQEKITGEIVEKQRFQKSQTHVLSCPYHNVDQLCMEFESKETFWLEFLFGNFSLFDYSKKYRDEIHVCHIYLMLHSGEKYCIFKAAQYQIHDFWPLFPALVRHYLVPDVHDYSRGKLKGMKHMFRNAGCKQIVLKRSELL